MYRSIHATASVSDHPQGLVVALFSDTIKLPRPYLLLDRQLGGELEAALARDEFDREGGSVTCLYPSQGVKRLFVLGLGEQERFRPDVLRQGLGSLVQQCEQARLSRLHVELMPGLGRQIKPSLVGRMVGQMMGVGHFSFDAFKGAGQSSEKKAALKLTLEVESSQLAQTRRGLKIAESVNLARSLAATPPNIANPAWLVRRCRTLGRQVGLSCSVVTATKASQLGMGGLTAVGAGGSTPPAIICFEHRPPGTAASSRPVLLVGKAVTFDTGGYSIKPSASMEGMKYDKCGGMAVIGAMHAIAMLQLPIHVVGLIPTAENMVDTHAYRPGDILTCFNGVTVEVTNTDAEGRLLLADALSWGTQQYKPRAVIDLATLTGGVVVALGSFCAGCFCSDHRLRSRLFDAAEVTGERLWHLPLWEEHRQMLKGTHSDLVNSGGRGAHPIQGAAFLSYFVGQDSLDGLPTLPWAHLDIAGVSDLKQARGGWRKGPTGFGVSLLVSLLENWSD